MNKEKLYMDIDYLFAWNDYEFHMKDGSVFVAYCEQDGGIRWKLQYYISISIKNEDVEYILDLGRRTYLNFESSDTEEDLFF